MSKLSKITYIIFHYTSFWKIFQVHKNKFPDLTVFDSELC